MESLQQEFGSSLQVLVVTQEQPAKIDRLKERNKVFASIKLPIIVSDSLLSGMFPYNTVPHHVWICNRKVVAITHDSATSAANISALLMGNMPSLPFKYDNVYYDKNEVLLVNGNGGTDDRLISRTTVTAYLPGLSKSYKSLIAADKRTRKTLYINHPILALYEAALGRPLANRVVLEVSETGRYIAYEGGQARWVEENSYSVEVITPAATPALEARRKLLAALNTSFNLYGRIEKRVVPCLVLTGFEAAKRLESKGGTPQLSFGEKENPGIKVRNKPLADLINALNTGIVYYPGHPFITDETRFKLPIDIDVPATSQNIEALKEAFARHGLQLRQEHRELEVFVLSENIRL